MSNIKTTNASRPIKSMRFKYAYLCCTALLALQPLYAHAQQATQTTDDAQTSSNSIVLDTVTINGESANQDSQTTVATTATMGGKISGNLMDIPAAVSVITSKEIQQRDAQSIEQVIQYTPGVVADFYGSDDRFDYFKIRGFDAYMYRDGLNIGRPFGGVREEVYAFERVEVLRGSDSTLFGLSDPGGSVNLVSKKPRSERFGEVYVSGGSFSHKEIGLDLGDNITKDDTLSYRFTAKLKDAKMEYDHSRDDEQFFMGGLTWHPTTSTNLTIVYDYLKKDGVPGSGGHPIGTNFSRSKFFGEPDYNYRGVNRNTVSLFFNHDFNNGLSFATTARKSKTDSDFGYAYISATPTNGSTIAQRAYFGNDSARDDFIIDSHFQYEHKFENIESRSVFGGEYNNNKTSSKSYFAAAPSIDWTKPHYTGAPSSVPLFASSRNKQDSKAIYFQQNLTFYDKFIVAAGVRNDWMDIHQTNRIRNTTQEGDLSEFTSRIGLGYKFTPQIMAYTSYAESAVPSSINVDPERGKQVEAGLKYSPDAIPAMFTVSIYDLTKTNITITDPITLLQSPVGKIRVKGIDLEAKVDVSKSFNLIASYSHLDSKIIEDSSLDNIGKRLQFVPENIASLWANYTLEGKGQRGDMNFGFGARYSSGYYFDNKNTIDVGGTTVFDASYSFEFVDKTTFQLNVSNLFDKKYVAYGGFGANFYNPGRSFDVSLRRTW